MCPHGRFRTLGLRITITEMSRITILVGVTRIILVGSVVTPTHCRRAGTTTIGIRFTRTGRMAERGVADGV
jgi:hypothetical protein